jgi:XTP/dITP diphosphohydrolase
MVLYACTSNPGKLREFLNASEESSAQLRIEPLPGLRAITPPAETGDTFEANSGLKAVYYSHFYPGLIFADDSGLEVDALNGRPGVRSARYAGEHSTDAENNALLLRELNGIENRKARFVSVISVARSGRLICSTRGTVEGEMLTAPRGSSGFGYDPLFFCYSLGKTLAEASEGEKFAVSHRGNAMRALFKWIEEHGGATLE